MNLDEIRILIVDDVEDNRLVLKGICRKLEHVVLSEAENGQEALDQCDALHPHIVLIDMMMPVMDGFEATKKIKEKYPKTIVVIVTAVADPQTEEKMIRCGATAYITKPVDRDLVRFKLQNYIGLLRVKSNSQDVFSYKRALNPFSNEIRSFKTIFQIEIADDMMDFGSWLMGWYEVKKGNSALIFGMVVDFLYRIMNLSLSKSESLTVVVEEDFDHLYLTMIMDSALVLDGAEEEFATRAGDNFIIKDNTVYFRVCIDDLYECMYGCSVDETVDLQEETPLAVKEVRAVSSSELEMLRHSFVLKTHAADYVADIGGDVLEDMRELSSLDDEWSVQLDLLASHPSAPQLLSFVDSIIAPYAKTIHSLIEFEAVAYALMGVSGFLKSNAQEIVAKGKMPWLVVLLDGMNKDLSEWRTHIFILKEVDDIHYMDASFFSACLQIESLIANKEIENSADDMELF
jgi:two-component system chemotaxis response regulator CheY